jgi:hypothetical protein
MTESMAAKQTTTSKLVCDKVRQEEAILVLDTGRPTLQRG